MSSSIFFILLISLLSCTYATHFRFGTISWRIPDTTQPNVVYFFSSFAFRRTFFGKPVVGSTINPGTFSFGDGSASEQLLILVSSIDTVNDWAAGTFTTTHTYPAGVVKNYTALHTAAGRIDTLNNNPNLAWNVSCTVSIGQTVTDMNGNLVPNSAPVSNNLPIVNVYSNEVNNFSVTAQDPEGSPLTYSLGTPLDMGGTSLTLAPKLNVTSSGNVTFDTRGINAGFWCTQVKFSDGLCYAVVDFLIFVAPRPKQCASACTNKAALCSVDGNCTSCPSGNCVAGGPPYFISPPTPPDRSAFTQAVNTTATYGWSAISPYLNSNVTVTYSSLPAGSILSVVNSGSTSSATLVWTPTMAQVGVYVITLGCYETFGQSCQGQLSFSITVPKPFCGYGTITPANCLPSSRTCGCICNGPGYDPKSLCYDCIAGYYGSSCLPCPNCVYGVCNAGIGGTGTCSCYSGWQGSTCNVTINAPCSLASSSSIYSTTSTGTFVNPSSTSTIISTNASKPALSVPLTTYVPNAPTKLDVLLLVDVTKSISSTMFNYLLSAYASNFFSGVRGLVANSYFAVSSFTDEPLGPGCSVNDYPFRLHSPLSPDLDDYTNALNTYMKTTSLGCDDTASKNDAQLDALLLASSSAVGWRTDAFRIVILITDSPFWEGAGGTSGSVYANRTDVYNALVTSNIVPILLSTSAAATQYTGLINSFGFGVSLTVANDFNNAYTVALSQFSTLFKTLWTVVAQDNYGFVRSVTAVQTVTPPTTKASSVSLLFPQAYLNLIPTFPNILVTTMGWGSANIIAQVNRKPSPSVCTVTTREDISVEVPVTGYDADGNAMYVVVETLPSIGTLFLNKSSATALVRNSQYTIPDGSQAAFLSYLPNKYKYGTDYFQFYLFDGCARSVSLNCSITVTFYDYPPVANSIFTNVSENTNLNFNMSGSDVETPDSQLVFIVLSLPDPSLGVLRRINTGAAVALNDVFSAGENTVQFVPVRYACCDSAVFTYQLRDSAGQTSNTATGSIFITAVNQVPVASASSLQVDRAVRTPIVLSVFDPDKNDQELFTVTSYSGVTFSNAAGVAFGAAPVNLGTVTVDSNGAASMTVYYTSPAAATGTNYASLTFSVNDTLRTQSTPVTVQVSINPVNRVPSANPAGPIPLFQDSQSAIWNLNGTDLDPADANSLVVQIMAIPTKGVLSQAGAGGFDITAAQTLLSYPYIVYRSSQTGDDSFSFRVVDNLGATSNIQLVRLNITAVNHAPTAVLSPINMVQDTNATAQINTYDQDGDNVTVFVVSLPRNGTLYQFTGEKIATVPTALTDSLKRFKFGNNLYESGTPYTTFLFYADDGQRQNNSRSPNITGVINVQAINYPPVPSPITVVLNENDPTAVFTLNATDIETPAAQLTGFLTSLPSSTIGVLRDLSGNALAIRTPIPGPRSIQFIPTPYAFGNATFSFGVNDGTVDSTVIATATIVVNHINQRPVLTTTSPITATRAVPLTVSLSVFDYDVGDNISILINSISGSGQLSFNSINITSAPFRLPVNFTIPNSNSVTIQLSYLAPVNSSGTGFASFSFIAQDSSLSTNASTVSVSIAQNQIPSANPAGPLRATQDFVSAPISLNGTDADVADANSLTVIITSLPSSGVLYQGTTNTTINVTNTIVPSGSVSYLTYQRAAAQFSFVVRDNLGALSSPVTVATVITPTNHPPSAYWIGTASTLEDTNLTITNIQASDPDAGDTITIIVPQAPSQGTLLQFNNNPCTYPCTVTDSQYRMKFVPGLHGFGTPYATISFIATDGSLNSSSVSGPLNIIFVDYPPVAIASTISILENDAFNPVSTNIALNYTDIDTQPMFIFATIVSVPAIAFGSLTNASGAQLNVGDTVGSPFRVVFTPNSYIYGATGFSFYVRDNLTTSNTVQVTINITHVNHPPVARWIGNAVGNEDTNVTITQIQVSDPDVGDTLTVTAYAPTNGTLLQFDGTPCASFPCNVTDSQYRMRFMPALHAYGYPYATFLFTVTDGSLTSPSVSGSITINFVDYPPIAYGSTFTILEDDSPKLITLNYSDFDSSPSVITTTVLSLPSPSIGRLTTQAGTPIAVGDIINSVTIAFVQVKYSPGSTSFSFRVKDSLSFSNSVQVNLNIQHVNHAPSIYWVGTAVTDEDTQLNITQIQTFDPDAGDKVTVSVTQGPPLNAVGGPRLYQFNGTQCTAYPCLILDPQYRMSFVAPPDANGLPYATIKVQAFDGIAYSDSPAEASGDLYFNPVNDPPTVSSSNFSVDESQNYTFSIVVSDVDSSDLSVVILTVPNPSIGSLVYKGATLQAGNSVPSNASITFVTVKWANGDTNFTFYGYDNQLTSDPASVSIHINPIPQAPICGVSPSSRLTVLYPSTTTVQLTVFDPDPGEKYTFTVTAVDKLAISGTLTDPNGNSVTTAPYQLATNVVTTNMYGEIPITYSVTDQEPSSYFYIEFTISDAVNTSFPCSVSFNSSDNYPPNATAVPVVNTLENTDTQAFTLNGVDDKGQPLRVLITDLPRYGVLYQEGPYVTINSPSTYLATNNYQVKYSPNPYFHGIDTFRFVVQDTPGAVSNLTVVVINVTHVNHPPTITAGGNVTTNEDTPITITGVYGYDIDGDPITVYIAYPPANGSFTQANGALITVYPAALTDPNYDFIFIPAPDEFGSPYITFGVFIGDYQYNTTAANATITVNAVDDPPIAKDILITLKEMDPPLNITLPYVDIDSDPSVITFSIISLPSNTLGTLTNGTTTLVVGSTVSSYVTFNPAQYSYGNSSFSFKVKDASSFSANYGVVTIAVEHVNHPPTAFWTGIPVADENQNLTITEIQASDHDVGDVLTVYVSQPPANGTLLQYNGSSCQSYPCLVTDSLLRMLFVPTRYEYGTPYATFSFYATDGMSNSSVVNATININHVDQPPVALVTNVGILENDPPTTVVLNYYDIDSPPANMSTIILSLPPTSFGTLSTTSGAPINVSNVITGTSFVFTPGLYSYGVATFSFQVQDSTSASNIQSITINITHVNHAPSVLWSGVAQADEDSTLVITNIKAFDPDAIDTVVVYISAGPLLGSIQQFNGSLCVEFPCLITDPQYRLKFVPAPNGNGNPYANITIYASDGLLNSTPPVIGNFIINPVDDPPIANPVTITLNENDAAATITLAYTDIDSDPSAIYGVILSLPDPSIAVISNDTSAVPLSVGDYVPTLNITLTLVPYASGNTSFSFQVHDQTSYSANSATVSIVVNHVNHPPFAYPATVVAVRGQPLSIVLSGFDYDKQDTFKFVLVAVDPHQGVFAAGGNTITSSTQYIADGINNTLSGSFSTIITYTAPVTASGNNFAYITYQTQDQGLLSSAAQNITIDITPNSVPIATPTTITAIQDGGNPPIYLNGTDLDPADRNSLIVVITLLPTKGVLLLANGVNVTSAPFNLTVGTGITYYTTQRGSDSLEFHVMDNLGAVSGTTVVPISITPVNHAPIAEFHGPVATLENTNITINQISVTDPDGDPVFVFVTDLPNIGKLYQYDGTRIAVVPTLITSSQLWVIYEPPTETYGSTSFSFYATDGSANSSEIIATVAITQVNGAPIAVSDEVTGDENISINITLGAVDPDTPCANISGYITALPDSAIGILYDLDARIPVSIFSPIVSRAVQFVPAAYAYGNTSFSFKVNDGQSDSPNTGVFTIAINFVNHNPTVSYSEFVHAERGQLTTISIYAADNDAPEAFNFTIISYYVAPGASFTFKGVDLGSIITGLPFVLVSNDPKSASGNYYGLNFTGTPTGYGNNYANISFIVYDAHGGSTNVTEIIINIGPGSPPTAAAAGPISMLEESTSDTFQLSGADSDPADEGSLRIQITSLPSKAVLALKGVNGTPDTNITTVGTILYNATVYLIGKQLSYGTDQFTFVVLDRINSSSAPSTVPISITHINHPPTAGVAINPGLMNQPLLFNAFGQDPDNDRPIVILITQIPAVGTLYQGDGVTPITSASATLPVMVTDFNGRLVYVPPTNKFGDPIANFSFYVDDSSGYSDSSSTTITIPFNISRVDLPPTVSNVNTSMLQDTKIVLPIIATDPQGYKTIVSILAFPLYGTLYQSDGVTEITPTSPTTGSDNIIIYVPPAAAHDNGLGPYASFTYRATSSNSSMTSNTGYASISVNSTINPPQFTGSTSYSIADNTNLTMLLTGKSEVGSYSILLLSSISSDRGILFIRGMCMGDEGCPITTISPNATNYEMSDPNMENRLRYAPPTDAYGDAFAIFTIVVVDKYGKSAPINITINIYHVNIPPVIHPYIYYVKNTTYSWTNAIINAVENIDSTIVWAVTDKDTPQANLSTILYALPYRGQLFTCVDAVNGSCVAGTAITTTGYVILPSTDGYFRAVYRSVAGSSGQNYATVSIIAYDGIDRSLRISLKINVAHKNLAPYISVDQTSWSTSEATPIIVSGISFNDTDASFYQEMFVISLRTPTGSIVDDSQGSLTLIPLPSSCSQTSNYNLTCTGTIVKLNQAVQQILINVSTAGTYSLVVFIDDLGAGADTVDRATSHLNDTAYLQINVTQVVANPVSKPGNNAAMTAIIASSAGAGAAAAIWRYMKKRHPPTQEFFGEGGADIFVTDNPLYSVDDTQQNLMYSSSIYEGR